MVKSMNAAISGLRTHQSKMDVISNNIANVNTWGYKTRTANFQDSLYQNVTLGTGGDVDEGGIGGINSSQLGFGVNLGSISTNFSTGAWGYTGDGLNCMIDGTGFFIVGQYRDPAGTAPDSGPVENTGLSAAGMSLTRVGIFTIDDNGCLVDSTGRYVYGYVATDPDDSGTGGGTADDGDYGIVEDDGLTPIQIPIKDDTTTPPTRFQIESVSIASDGSVIGIDSDNVKVVFGRIGIASVENVNGLDQTAGYHYNIGSNAGQVVAGFSTAATGSVLSNYLEMSNVDLASEIANMITTQRGYQANTKIITVTDEMLAELVNMKR